MRTNLLPFQTRQCTGSAHGIHPAPGGGSVPDTIIPSWRHLLSRFSDALGLSPDQLAAIQPTFDAAEAEFTVLRLEATAKAQHVLDEALIAMRPLLSPHQRELLDLCKRIDLALRRAAQEPAEQTSGSGAVVE